MELALLCPVSLARSGRRTEHALVDLFLFIYQ